jgi:hypothetical protein
MMFTVSNSEVFKFDQIVAFVQFNDCFRGKISKEQAATICHQAVTKLKLCDNHSDSEALMKCSPRGPSGDPRYLMRGGRH